MDVSSPAQMHMVLCCCKKVWTSCSKICRKRHGCNIFSYWAFFMLRSAKWLWLGAIIWQWHPLRGHCIAGCKTVFRDSDLQLCQLTHCDTKCSSYELNWNFLDPGKMLWLIWQRWFCSVSSPCSNEEMSLSHPLHRAETEFKLLRNLGVCTCSIWKAFLLVKILSVSLWLQCQCPCWKLTIYHRFVYLWSRYALFWWLVPEKIAFCLQASCSIQGQNIDFSKVHFGQTEHSLAQT